MKRAALVGLFLLLGLSAFANPFVGRWEVSNNHERRVELVIGETSVLQAVSADGVTSIKDLGEYSATDRLLIIGGIAWLFYIQDADHIGLIAWVVDREAAKPTIIILTRVLVELEDPA